MWACERALERGLLPHTNLGVLSREDLARLREVTASQGLMLESISERLMETVHAGSPTKHPARRLETIRAAGELRIPFTSGILVGIGESEEERVASLEALAELHAEHGHIQEVILQNFVPHQRYYGQEPAQIADESRGCTGARGRRGTRGCDEDERGEDARHRERAPSRATRCRCRVGLPGEHRGHEAADRRGPRLMPDVGIQVPPEPCGLVAGARGRRRDRPRRAVANGDHISPEHPFPSPHQVRKRLRATASR